MTQVYVDNENRKFVPIQIILEENFMKSHKYQKGNNIESALFTNFNANLLYLLIKDSININQDHTVKIMKFS